MYFPLASLAEFFISRQTACPCWEPVAAAVYNRTADCLQGVERGVMKVTCGDFWGKLYWSDVTYVELHVGRCGINDHKTKNWNKVRKLSLLASPSILWTCVMFQINTAEARVMTITWHEDTHKITVLPLTRLHHAQVQGIMFRLTCLLLHCWHPISVLREVSTSDFSCIIYAVSWQSHKLFILQL